MKNFTENELKKIMDNQYPPNDDDLNSIDTILSLYSKNGNFYAAMNIFEYGKIQGIRAERARKSKKERAC